MLIIISLTVLIAVVATLFKRLMSLQRITRTSIPIILYFVFHSSMALQFFVGP
jgi:hypothetical protein